MGAKAKAALLAVMLLGAGLRVAFVAVPLYDRDISSWREADYIQIARNFYQEGMNPLSPRVDWREDTSGYVEMEFPILPWGAALLYQVFGYNEAFLRVLSALFSLAALGAFGLLARHLLSPAGAFVATGAFAANGLLIAMSTSIQPEPAQLLLTILAASAALRWSETGTPRDLLLAGTLTASAILAKSPAAYLGFVLAYLVLRHRGLRAFRDRWVYLAALVALLPPAIWYLWAHQHYLATGLSLGLSNETHFLNREVLLTPATPLWFNFRAELFDVFAVAGLPLALGACLQPWRKIEGAAVWYFSVLLFYILAADTSGDQWAFYYHANSVAPACLLIGFGFMGWRDLAATLDASARARAALSVALRLLVVLTVAGFTVRGAQHLRRTEPRLESLHKCAERLERSVPPGERIVFRGGSRLDAHGHAVAYNASPVFAWVDRKGFNYAVEDFSLDELEQISERGGRYWIAGLSDLAQPEVREDVERRFRLIDSCDEWKLYDLDKPPILDAEDRGRPSMTAAES